MSINITDLSTFQDSFEPNEVSSWFSNVMGRVAEPSDVYQVQKMNLYIQIASQFYKQGLYNKAITALEFYVLIEIL